MKPDLAAGRTQHCRCPAFRVVRRRACWFLTVSLALALTGCNTFRFRTPQIRKAHDGKERGQEKCLRVYARIASGFLQLDQAEAGRLYDVDMQWDAANMSRSCDYRWTPGEDGHLTIKLDGRVRGHENIRTVISLSGDIPVELTLENGAGESNINLTGLQVSRITLKGGVGNFVVNVDKPQKSDCESLMSICGVGQMELHGLGNLSPQRLDFKGGVGQAVLDFTGEAERDMNARMEMGVGQTQIVLPVGLGVKLSHKGTFLSQGFSIPAGHFNSQTGDRYFSNNFQTAQRKLDLNIRSGIGNVCVQLKEQ